MNGNEQPLVGTIATWTELNRLVDSLRSDLTPNTTDFNFHDRITLFLENQISKLSDDVNSDLPLSTVDSAWQERLSLSSLLDQRQLQKLSISRSRYSDSNLCFAVELATRSPSAYRFMQSSGQMLLSSIRTIQRMTATYHCEPGLSQSRIALLKGRTRHLRPVERTFVLQFDEIHIQKKLELKSGRVRHLSCIPVLPQM